MYGICVGVTWKPIRIFLMCIFNTKLKAFGYILSLFVAHQRRIAKEFCAMELYDDKLCKTFSNKRIMKLLYLLCLESVSVKDRDCGLFNIFNKMIAYPYGPVEQDLYDSLNFIPLTTYKDGQFTKLPDLDEYLHEVALTVEVKNSIDTAFEKLAKSLTKDDFLNRDELIKKIHNLCLWSRIYMFKSYDNRLMPVSDYEAIEEEIRCYRQNLNSRN